MKLDKSLEELLNEDIEPRVTFISPGPFTHIRYEDMPDYLKNLNVRHEEPLDKPLSEQLKEIDKADIPLVYVHIPENDDIS